MSFKHMLLGCAALALALPPITPVEAAGSFSTLPVLGGSAFCGSYIGSPTGQSTNTGTGGGTGAGSVCGQTIPAGPPSPPTGEEMMPADYGANALTGSHPQTVAIPSSLLGNSTNRLIGGDMTTNLAQRSSTAKGVTALANTTPTAAIITADRWWVASPTAAVTTTIDSTAATAVIPGVNNTKALRVARTTSGAAGLICSGQTLDAAASAPLIGNNAVFSFYEFNGAGQSASNGNITVNVDYSTAGDTTGTQGTLGYAGGNGSLFALGDIGLLSAGPTNMTRGIAGGSPGTTASIAAGVATIAASTTWTRYAVYAPIPVNAPGTSTAVTNVSVSVCFKPVATTASTTDYIELNDMQLEAKPSTPTADLPAGVISPSAFEQRNAATEAVLQRSYWYFNYEQQSLGLSYVGACENTSTSVANCGVVFPVPMRITPVVKWTDGFQVFAQVGQTSLNACTSLGLSASLASFASNTGFLMNCTATVGAAGTANELMALGTSSATGIISASAEP